MILWFLMLFWDRKNGLNEFLFEISTEKCNFIRLWLGFRVRVRKKKIFLRFFLHFSAKSINYSTGTNFLFCIIMQLKNSNFLIIIHISLYISNTCISAFYWPNIPILSHPKSHFNILKRKLAKAKKIPFLNQYSWQPIYIFGNKIIEKRMKLRKLKF